MSLNDHFNPSYPTFTLEDLGLSVPQGNLPQGDKGVTDSVNLHGVLGDQKPNAPTAVIETDTTTPGPHNTNLSQDEINQLPTWDSKIKILKEHADKIVDMREVQKDVEGTGAIDRLHSDIVEATFESFYSPSNLRGMFTSFESQTNYNQTKAFMAKKIAVSLEALMVEYTDIATNGASEQAKSILKSRDFCVFGLRDIFNEAISHIAAVTDILSQGPIILPMKDGSFIDMTNVDYSTLNIDDIKDSVPFTDEFYLNFKKMVCVWKEVPELRQFVDVCVQGHCAVYPGSQVPQSSDGLFLATLITGFGQWSIDFLYGHFVETADQHVEDLTEIQSELREAIAGGSDAASVIGQRGGQWASLATKLAENQGVAVKVGEFVKAAANVVVGMASLR